MRSKEAETADLESSQENGLDRAPNMVCRPYGPLAKPLKMIQFWP
jgi:hypothetical protein